MELVQSYLEEQHKRQIQIWNRSLKSNTTLGVEEADVLTNTQLNWGRCLENVTVLMDGREVGRIQSISMDRQPTTETYGISTTRQAVQAIRASQIPFHATANTPQETERAYHLNRDVINGSGTLSGAVISPEFYRLMGLPVPEDAEGDE